MNRIAMAAVLGLGMGLVAVASAGKPAPAAASTVKEENCGAMLKQMAALPNKFSELMNTVADGMTAHANWVAMNKDPKAQAEATAMKKVAQDHRDMAVAAKKTATDMEAAATLAPAPHDGSKMDPKMMGDAMLKQAALEKEMAAMMIKHAEETEKQVAAMKPAAAAPAKK